jgi:hypothetical protein
MTHNLKVVDADGVTRRIVSIDTDVGGSGDEVHLQTNAVVTGPQRVLGHELLAPSTTVTKTLGQGTASAGVPAGSRSAIISVEGFDVRYRMDGTAPAATPTTDANAGHLLPVGTALEVAVLDAAGAAALANVVFRGTNASASTLIVTYLAARVAD